MTVRKDKHKDFEDKQIYDLIYRQWSIHLHEWYYVTKDVIKYILYRIQFENQSKHLEIFCKLVDKTRQTVRNNVAKWEYLHLKDWYYNKKELLHYLINL